MPILLEGIPVAQSLYNTLRVSLDGCARKPCLATVLTTNNPASIAYVNKKIAACKEVGIEGRLFHLTPSSTEEILHFIDALNADSSVDGILVQMPLPPKIDSLKILERIAPDKDVDGFHPLNVGKAFLQDPSAFYPCTPLGIKALLEYYKIPVEGNHVVIIGRSNIVGKPLASLLLHNAPGCNATVTVAHSKSKNLKEITLSADILVSAIGKPKFVTSEMVKEGVVIVDVGSNIIEDLSTKSKTRYVGDVDFTAVFEKCHAITPVPKGVGPMTIASLLQNTVKSYLSRQKA